MSDIATIDEIFEGLGIIEYYETRGEAKTKAEIARNLKATGDPLDKIARVTGLDIEALKGL